MTRPGLELTNKRLCLLGAAVLAVWMSVSPAWARDTLNIIGPSGQQTVQVVVTGPSGQVPQDRRQLAWNPLTQDLRLPALTPSAAPPTTSGASPSATAAPTQRARIPGSLKLVIGVVAIVFGVTIARRASRRGNDDQSDQDTERGR